METNDEFTGELTEEQKQHGAIRSALVDLVHAARHSVLMGEPHTDLSRLIKEAERALGWIR